jgi:hypothetical protein
LHCARGTIRPTFCTWPRLWKNLNFSLRHAQIAFCHAWNSQYAFLDFYFYRYTWCISPCHSIYVTAQGWALMSTSEFEQELTSTLLRPTRINSDKLILNYYQLYFCVLISKVFPCKQRNLAVTRLVLIGEAKSRTGHPSPSLPSCPLP